MHRTQAIDFLVNTPYKFGHLMGFEKLTELHNGWIRDMVIGEGDKTLQAHRGSYKTTCISVALALLCVLRPNLRIAFIRKTDDDVKEIIKQVQKMLRNERTRYLVKCIYGEDIDLRLTAASVSAVSTNLTNDVRGTAQIIGIGMGSSLTGKHFDRIFTDDIVNRVDRVSKAERERTKSIYMELQNIRNPGGRIYNTGTPWHKDDAFSLMPNPERFDCYNTGLMAEDDIAAVKAVMTASLFAANYELRHIAAEDVIFDSPQTGGDPSLVEQGECHIDAAYGGGDYTAFTICRKSGGKYYVFGKCWPKHIDDVTDEIIRLRKLYNGGRIYVENNGDKGYLGKALRAKGERVSIYHEGMNKFLKITSYLKSVWRDVIFVDGTDKEYIDQICDYNENAEHDDCPDSLSSMIRKLWNRGDRDPESYPTIFG